MIRTPLLLLAALGLATACSQGAASLPDLVEHEARLVRTAEVQPAPATQAHRLYGITEAADRAELSFPFGGRVVARPVEVGDAVQRGQRLAMLDTEPLRHAHTAAHSATVDLQTRLAQAQRDALRAKTLFEQRSATEQELERANAKVSSLQASLDAAQAQTNEAARRLREATLEAPFDGIVAAVHVEPGETTTPGASILSLRGQGAVEVTLGVPEALVPGLTVGAHAQVDLPALGREGLEGTVRQVGGAALGAASLFPVVVTVQSEQWLASGLTAEVVLYSPVDARIAVPMRSIVDPTGDNPSVFRVQDGVAQRVAVTPSILLGDQVAVDAALLPSDELVVDGLVGLLDGEPVQVLR